MSDMLERICEALWDHDIQPGQMKWQNETREAKHQIRQGMRAALLVAREPDEGMVAAGEKAWREAVDEPIEAAFQAMIDVIMKGDASD